MNEFTKMRKDFNSVLDELAQDVPEEKRLAMVKLSLLVCDLISTVESLNETVRGIQNPSRYF